jgi:hypothetical protein
MEPGREEARTVAQAALPVRILAHRPPAACAPEHVLTWRIPYDIPALPIQPRGYLHHVALKHRHEETAGIAARCGLRYSLKAIDWR